MKTLAIDADTDTDALVGGTFTEDGDTFTVVSADHCPGLNTVAFSARSDPAGRMAGCPFVAMLRYGTVLQVH